MKRELSASRWSAAVTLALSTALSSTACSSGSNTPSAAGGAEATGATAGSVGVGGARSGEGGSLASSSASSGGAVSAGGINGAGGSGVGGGSAALGGNAGVAGSQGLAGASGATASGGSGGAATSAGVAFDSDRVTVSGVRGTATPAAQAVIHVHNGGGASTQVTAIAISGANQALFKIASPSAFPATIASGADLAVTIEMTTTGASLPAAPADKNLGSVLLTGTLTATTSAGSATANLYGLVLTQANYEPTLGQILTTLGYKLNVGKAQDNWNPNTSMDATMLPGIETGTDEVAASHFVKAGSGNVTLTLVARFSPVGALPYGWYSTTTGCPTGCTTVGTMAMVTDPQTSDKARMVNPPLATGTMTSFDPGSAPFGLWVYSDQLTQKFNEGGTKTNGDWDYSEDALNSPAKVHRFKSYPLKDATGAAIAQTYLVAVEEAGNGDYQDYVFVLGHVTAMP